MTFPFESLSGDRRGLGLLVAVVLGAAFGYVLERCGFGRAQKLVGQFYGTDMTVFKVMFTAIVTAMVGAVALRGAGLLDLAAVSLKYPTYLWPMIAGGFLLGTGFVVSGYCPGTSLVAAASGKLDGLAAVAGVAVGGVLYAEALPALASFDASGSRGPFFLYDLLHVSPAAVAVAVTLFAIAAFFALERLERLVRGRPVAPVLGTFPPELPPELAAPADARGSQIAIAAEVPRAR